MRLGQISVGLPFFFYLPVPPPAREHDYEPVSLAPEMAAVLGAPATHRRTVIALYPRSNS